MPHANPVDWGATGRRARVRRRFSADLPSLRRRNIRVFVVENTGQLMTLRWSRYHVTRVGVHRIANVWKRAMRWTVPRCPVLSVDRVRGRRDWEQVPPPNCDRWSRVKLARVVPVALEHVDLRRADAQGAVVSSFSSPRRWTSAKRRPGPVPFVNFIRALEVPVPEDLREENVVAAMLLGSPGSGARRGGRPRFARTGSSAAAGCSTTRGCPTRDAEAS